MFHPDGVVYRAAVTPAAAAPYLVELSERLAGQALVRFSSALWRDGHEWPDVLGAAVRFTRAQPLGAAPPGSVAPQDLLLATIRSPWTLPFALLATDFRSFLWSHYHAVSPFEVDGVGIVKFRLRSPRFRNAVSQSRAMHLRNVTGAGRAVFELQLRRSQGTRFARRWDAVALLTLQAPLEVDQQALRFSPFNDAAGVHPVGLVHALRVAVYAASQAARPATDGAEPPSGISR